MKGVLPAGRPSRPSAGIPPFFASAGKTCYDIEIKTGFTLKEDLTMFFSITDKLTEIKPGDIDSGTLTVGIVTSEELKEFGPGLGLDDDTIAASQQANSLFRTGVEVRDDYTFAELRLVNGGGEDDFISVFFRRNLLLVVDILDADNSTRDSFVNALKKKANGSPCLEKLICHFIEALLSGGSRFAEALQIELTKIEEAIVAGTAEKDMNRRLLTMKKSVLKYYGFYSQMQDIAETLEENMNSIFDPDRLIYLSNLTGKINRSREDVSWLNNTVDHLQDAYAAMLDQKLNNTMKVFTLITTIFFPLTIIVGWYGMNFTTMPELTWKYGYLYVIALSVIDVLVLYFIGKKKKWF